MSSGYGQAIESFTGSQSQQAQTVSRPAWPADSGRTAQLVVARLIDQAARDEEEKYAGVGDTSGWELGPQLRTRGSVHPDWWRGTAADLANSGLVAVYPVSGWWRESRGNDWSKVARYALVVTVRADPAAVGVGLFTPAVIDLDTPVAAAVSVAAAARTRVEVENDSGDGGAD